MSNAGPFIIISNDGRSDKLLCATSMLEARLNAIRAKNIADGFNENDPNSLPTLMEIEATHILYTTAYYKPFASIALAYINNPVQGSYSLGTTVRFNIQQYGDFFTDMALHVVMNEPNVTYASNVAAKYRPFGRWCAYPGERLLDSVRFTINGNILDQYTKNTVVFQRQLFTSPNKKLAWDRCMGQEQKQLCRVTDHTELLTPDYDDPTADANRALCSLEYATVTNGAQTPHIPGTKTLEMVIPFLFWFNQSVRLAFPSAAVPNNQRFLELQFANISSLYGLVARNENTDMSSATMETSNELVTTCELIVNNIYVLPQIHNIYTKRISFTLVRVNLENRQEIQSSSSRTLLSQLKWPIEYLMVGLRPTTYEQANATNLDRWHLFHAESAYSYGVDYTDDIDWVEVGELKEVKVTPAQIDTTGVYVSEAVYEVEWVDAATNTEGYRTADELEALFDKKVQFLDDQGELVAEATVTGTATTVSVSFSPPFPGIVQGDATAHTFLPSGSTLLVGNPVVIESRSATVNQVVDTINKLGVVAQGTTLYDNYTRKFYNSYIPYQYGGDAVTSPEDSGVCFVTFCLFPGTYQPSGHINVSRSREFYLTLESSYCSSVNVATLYVCASAINFLLVADGGAVLRFTN